MSRAQARNKFIGGNNTTWRRKLSRRLFGNSQKRIVRFGILSAYMALLAIVGIFVVTSSSDANSGPTSSRAQLAGATDDISNPLDEISSADVAVHVSRLVGLEESTAVTNTADTANAQLLITAGEDRVIVKPQILSASVKSRADIQRYQAKAGESIAKIATKFGVTSDTIRLSNNLTGDKVPTARTLLISPINGIVYTVKAGDTPESIASRYRASEEQLIAFNDAELTRKFKVGETIVVPDGLAPVAASASYGFAGGAGSYGSYGGYQASYGGNGYDYGWCTWHAANRRMQAGNPIPSNLGNAISWLGLARAAGLSTGTEPRAGAVLYHMNLGGLGHVAYVERINSNGSIEVSDMNYPIWGSVTYRTVKPSEFGSYRFIY